jgi:hypothetical protein
MTSVHYTTERQARERAIAEIGYGYTVKTVIVDRGHRNGAEIHSISSTGIITIQNERTKKMITKLIARPGQIARYYTNEEPPRWLMNIAREHLQKNLNNL